MTGRRCYGLWWLAPLPLWAACAAGGHSLRGALDDLVGAEALAGGRVGVVVADAATGTVLVEHASDRGFATASNMKLLSAAVALHTLGPDFRARTELVQRGEIEAGVLRGDLVLRGHGDPTLGEDGAGLEVLVAAVRRAGIRRVAGRVIGDGSFLGGENRGHGWQWDYLDADYAAPFGGLCMAGNVVRVRVRPGEQGALVECLPLAEPEPLVVVTQGAAGSQQRLEVTRRLGEQRIEVRGAIAKGAREAVFRVAVGDPARFAAAVLVERLRRGGIEVVGADLGIGAAPEHLIGAHDSPTLAAIAVPLLTNSNNLYAEQVWRLAARHATGAGDTQSAARHSRAFFRAIGIDPHGMVLADGSGLSRRNLVRPHQIAELLLWVHDAPFGAAFRAALPRAGHTGTLRNRFAAGAARGRVRAKTGYISRVVCLSGYVPRPVVSAPPLVFCVMLNDFTCSTDDAKAAVDAFVEAVARSAGLESE